MKRRYRLQSVGQGRAGGKGGGQGGVQTLRGGGGAGLFGYVVPWVRFPLH